MTNNYRASGSIGWVVPARCQETAVEEAYRMKPNGVTWCFASLGMDEIADRDMSEALAVVDHVVGELIERRVDLIAYSGLPLTASQGPLAHRDFIAGIIERTGTDIPIVSDTALIVDALHAFGARRVSLITPYVPQIVERVSEVFRAEGFEVADAVGRGWSLAEFITEPDDDTVFEMALESFSRQPDTDAFYLACPQWPVVGNIARIEEATGRPVVTQTQAISWWASRRLGVSAGADSGTRGRLFKEELS